jgi:hypothetical protein
MLVGSLFGVGVGQGPLVMAETPLLAISGENSVNVCAEATEHTTRAANRNKPDCEMFHPGLSLHKQNPREMFQLDITSLGGACIFRSLK